MYLKVVIREMQIKSTLRYHFTEKRMAITKKTDNNKCLQRCKEIGVPGHCCWDVKWCSHLGKQSVHSSKA